MELIISILFFSICGAICVQMFVNTHQTDISTSVSSKAILAGQNMCEIYSGCQADMNQISNMYGQTATIYYDQTTLIVYYDSDWNQVDAYNPNTCYCVALTNDSDKHESSESGTLASATVTVHTLPEIWNSASGDISTLPVISSQELLHYFPYRMEADK